MKKRKQHIITLNREERIFLSVCMVIILILIVFNLSLFNRTEYPSSGMTLDEVVERKYYYSKYRNQYSKEYRKTNQRKYHNDQERVHTKKWSNNIATSKYESKTIPESYKEEKTAKKPQQQYDLKPFDPNTSTKEELLYMGLPERWVKGMLKYRDKAGSYRNKEALKRLAITTDSLYSAIEPFIVIDESKLEKEEAQSIDVLPEMSIKINSASEEELNAIPFLNPGQVATIIKYRNLLGGYHSDKQLHEVYTLQGAEVDKLLPLLEFDPSLILLNVNDATEKELSKHPYISKKQAKVVKNYIKMHGPFEDVSDVYKTRVFDQIAFEKLRPYLGI